MKRCVDLGVRLAAVLLVAVALAVPTTGAAAAKKVVPGSTAEVRMSYAPLVKRAAPAVVNIYAKKLVRRAPSPLFDDPFFRRFFGDNLGLGPETRAQTSLGSGVLVRMDGLIVTNNHVIAGADEITVALADRREFDAKVLRRDERADLAVLKIDPRGEQLPFLELDDSDELEVGDLVLAIGNPFGVGQTVTSGIVSALARTTVGISDFRSFIQTDAAINPGNSGGALVGMDGRLVGINTAIYSKSGGSQGVGFAIPSVMVRAVIAGATGGGRLVRPWLGAGGQDLTQDIAESLGVSRPAGVLVNKVYPGGPADRGGVRLGDVILAVDGHQVGDGEALRFRVATKAAGDTIELTVLRRRHELTLPVVLKAPPEVPPRNETRLRGRHPLTGATVANLSPALAEELSMIDPPDHGVIVLAIDRGSPAYRVRLEPGDILLALNGAEITTVTALRRMLARGQSEWRLRMRRGRRVINMVMRR